MGSTANDARPLVAEAPRLAIWPEPSGTHSLDGIWHEAANRLYLHEAFRSPPDASKHKPGTEPYTRAWFEEIEQRRYSRQGHWLPRTLEFGRHAGETLLGLGEGLGTDWLQYARHGANVIACSPSQEQIELVRRNFELRGLTGHFHHAPPHRLPVESASVDVVCLQGLLPEVDKPATVINEVYRVLRPGGKVLAVVAGRHNARTFRRLVECWRIWSEPAQEPNGLGGSAFRAMFGQFADHKVSRRHLRRADLPHLLRWLPASALERLLGESLILKAFKPVTSVLGLAQAA